MQAIATVCNIFYVTYSVDNILVNSDFKATKENKNINGNILHLQNTDSFPATRSILNVYDRN